MKIRLLISVVALAFAATAVNAADPVDLRGKKGVVDPNDLKNPKPASSPKVDPKDLKKHDPKPPSAKPSPVPKP
jgi:hypothetical protein